MHGLSLVNAQLHEGGRIQQGNWNNQQHNNSATPILYRVVLTLKALYLGFDRLGADIYE